MASGQVSPKGGKVVDIPSSPTIDTATDLGTDGKISVAFTANSSGKGGPTFSYVALSNPGSITGTGTSSPITVSGLTNNTAYTFTVAGVNGTGNSVYSAASNSVTPTEPPGLYESIASYVATGGETSYTFSSIPQTYKHLQIRTLVRDTYSSGSADSTTAIMAMNGDNTGANYKYHYTQGNGSAVGAAASGASVMQVFCSTYGPTSAFAASIIDIHDYASTTKNKVVRTFMGADMNVATTGSKVFQVSGAWFSTSALTSLRFDALVTGFAAGSTFALYGIKG
jgi:hypothetical protein